MLRWLPTAFDTLKQKPNPAGNDFYPPHLSVLINRITPWMNDDLNTGVYKAGFAPDQKTYGLWVVHVFAALNTLERVLQTTKGGPFILGSELTELDIRAYTTVVRFDVVYVQHFKCNLGMVRHDYPYILAWLQHLYWRVPGFKETTDFKHIKENYTKSHWDINPKAITPMGPWPDVPLAADGDGLTRKEQSSLPSWGLQMETVTELAQDIWDDDDYSALDRL